MLHAYIKYFFIIICVFYLYRKLLNLHLTHKIIFIQTISAISMALLNYYMRLYFTSGSILILVMLLIAVNYLLYKQTLNITIVSSIIATGCSYILFIIATFLSSPLLILSIQHLRGTTLLQPASIFIIGCIQLLLSTTPFRFKRLKTGMPFLKEQGSSDIGAFIAISLLIATSFFNLSEGTSPYVLAPVFFIALSGILIFFWWKHKLTESYLTKLKEREIGELQKEISKLKEYNEISSKIIHKDNKAVPAMYFEVQHVLTELYDHVRPEDRELLTSALARIEPLVSERKGILQFSDAKAKSVYLTGSPAIDTLLKYQAYKAYAEQITFEVMATANVQMIVPDILSEADFRTLVADLVDNALNAVKHESKRNVLFHTRIHENTFYVDIYDSGAPFAKEVLEKMGKERITTHKNDGGSGIGYMSTFEILKRCNGTLDIDEHLDMETYTKKVSIGIPLNYEL